MKGLIILITGSSSGIGRAAACRFAQEGAKVILTYYRGKSRGREAQRRCRSLGAQDAMLLHLDVTNDISICRAADKAKEAYGSIDFLVNNAGTGVFKPFSKQSSMDIERQLRTNLEGLIKMTRVFLPLVKKGIINVASVAGESPYGEMSVYCGTKFGVRGFTQALALDRPRVQVCCVNPDETATRLSGYHGRPPEDVAEVIFLAASGGIEFRPGGDIDVPDIMRQYKGLRHQKR